MAETDEGSQASTRFDEIAKIGYEAAGEGQTDEVEISSANNKNDDNNIELNPSSPMEPLSFDHQGILDAEGYEAGRVEEEETISDNGKPPILLNYHFRTVIDDTGSMPGRVTVRCRMGNLLEEFKNVTNKNDNLVDMIKNAGFQHFLELEDNFWRSGCCRGGLCHYLLLRQIETNKKNELWFLVGNKPIRFGLNEFCLVTGLYCGPYPSEESIKKAFEDGKEFVNKVLIFLNKSSLYAQDLINIVNLREKKPFTIEERSRCATMYLLHSIILAPDQETKQVREDFLAFTASPDFFYSYPWGKEAYKWTLQNLKRDLRGKAIERAAKISMGDKPDKTPVKYTIAGLSAAFMVWAYEAIDIYGEKLGARSTELPNAIPRILRWHRDVLVKAKVQDWYNNCILENEVYFFPMLWPLDEEKNSKWMENFEELKDEPDLAIDQLRDELENVELLRPCDGIIHHVEKDEHGQNSEGQELSNEQHELNNEEQNNIKFDSSERFDKLERQVVEIQDILVKMDKKLDCLVKKQNLKQPLVRRMSF